MSPLCLIVPYVQPIAIAITDAVPVVGVTWRRTMLANEKAAAKVIAATGSAILTLVRAGTAPAPEVGRM